MLGNESRTWDLAISGVEVSDEGLYQCQILASSHSAPMRSDYATLTVFARPQPPVITSGPRLAVRAGTKSLVQCISKGARPATSISWTRNGDPLSDGIDTKVTNLPDLKTMTVSTLTFEVNGDMSGDILACEAANEAINIREKIETTLFVESTPKISITTDTEGPMYEGDRVSLLCDSESPAPVTDYTWAVGGKIVSEAATSRSLRLTLTRRMHQTVVTCAAGDSKAFLKLDVNCKLKISFNCSVCIYCVVFNLPLFVTDGPVFGEGEVNVTGDNGERIELRCEADSNPGADLAWVRDREPAKVGKRVNQRACKTTLV